LEDVIAVVDGRQKLVGEIKVAHGDVRSYLGKEIAKLLGAREFVDALPATPGLGESRANNNCHGETKRNRSTSIGSSTGRVPAVYLGSTALSRNDPVVLR
jgi:hypothetical protein